MTKLYIGNLPYTTTEDDLKTLFADYGTVLSATLITDRDSGRSKGFGFVELEDDAKALESEEDSTEAEAEVEEETIDAEVARATEVVVEVGIETKVSFRIYLT